MEIVKERVGSVTFWVDRKTKTLIKMETPCLHESVTIPSVLPNGVEIARIGPGFCFGSYPTITIDNKIKRVCRCAFKNAIVFCVVWPSGCHTIPERCFEDSAVEELLNISHVKVIGPSAFGGSHINEIKWPIRCKKIPEYCFCNCSYFKRIFNTDNVAAIGRGAFLDSKIEEFAWPAKCKTIPNACFCGASIKRLTNYDEVTQIEPCAFQFSLIEQFTIPKAVRDIWFMAFAGCKKLQKLELHDEITSIYDNVFVDASIDNIRWPLGCSRIPSGCFDGAQIGTITNLSHVSEICEEAFHDAVLTDKLDFEQSPINVIGDGSFAGVDRDKVLFPYYMSEDEIQRAFTERELAPLF